MSNSLETVINKTGFITINKRKGAGFTVSRSGHVKTSVQQGSLYRFSVGAPQGLKYSENRDLLEGLDTLDITQESNVSIGGNNSGIAYVTTYLGNLDDAEGGIGANITVNNASESNIYVDLTSVTYTDGTVTFKKGDFIQPKGSTGTYRYPYQVTEEVSGGTGANVRIPVHRPILSQDGVALTSGGLRIGIDCRFHVICANMPTYSVVPHDLIEFTEDFELIERIT